MQDAKPPLHALLAKVTVTMILIVKPDLSAIKGQHQL